MEDSWIQIISLFLANAGLILWFRTESRNDWRHMDNKMEENRRETNSLITAIQEEMKDFHCKLFQLECEQKNLNKEK